jgi:MFS superfamily sulfate permease-like transporter
MTISIQTLQDVLVALVTIVGLTVAVSIAIMAAGAIFKRDQARAAAARRPVASPAQHPTQTDEAHEPVLR